MVNREGLPSLPLIRMSWLDPNITYEQFISGHYNTRRFDVITTTKIIFGKIRDFFSPPRIEHEFSGLDALVPVSGHKQNEQRVRESIVYDDKPQNTRLRNVTMRSYARTS